MVIAGSSAILDFGVRWSRLLDCPKAMDSKSSTYFLASVNAASPTAVGVAWRLLGRGIQLRTCATNTSYPESWLGYPHPSAFFSDYQPQLSSSFLASDADPNHVSPCGAAPRPTSATCLTWSFLCASVSSPESCPDCAARWQSRS